MEKQKSFDAVRCMREIRDALSREFQGMSFEEKQRYIRERVHVHPTEDSSGKYAAQPADAGDGGPGILSEHSKDVAHRPSAPDP
jgi:hypothetical protein